MLDKINVKDPVFQFIVGYFHQDCGDPEESLQEYLSEESPKHIRSTLQSLKEFLTTDTTEQEKNEFIIYCASGIYYPAIGQTPVQWLEGVVSRIEDHLQK